MIRQPRHRAPLQGDPTRIGCFRCTPGADILASDRTFRQMRVVEVIEPRRDAPDPTIAYVLECGHTVI